MSFSVGSALLLDSSDVFCLWSGVRNRVCDMETHRTSLTQLCFVHETGLLLQSHALVHVCFPNDLMQQLVPERWPVFCLGAIPVGKWMFVYRSGMSGWGDWFSSGAIVTGVLLRRVTRTL